MLRNRLILRWSGDLTKPMNRWTLARNLFLVMIITTVFWECSTDAARGAGRETPVPDLQFQPAQPTKAYSIRESVDTAVRNYPTIRQKFFKLRAAKANVSLAKMQYLPNLNIDTQISGVTPNRIASV